MDDRSKSIARNCLQAAEHDAMTFPQIVAMLMQEGFESYAIDFRRCTAIYFQMNGESVELSTHRVDGDVPEVFDKAAVQAAIREAQTQAAGYSYAGFCRKVVAAGCSGYTVSMLGRRAVYFGRTAETHVEHFPQ